jgi:hypothetical protein
MNTNAIKFALGVSLLFCGLVSREQTVKWEKASAWRLYFWGSQNDPPNKDSIAEYKSAVLETDTMKYYMHLAVAIDTNRSAGANWMGEYWGSCKYLQKVRLIRISRYGGFFRDEDSGLYYELPIDLRSAWYGYLNNRYLTLER